MWARAGSGGCVSGMVARAGSTSTEASRTIEVEKPDLVPFVASLRTTPASGSAGELNYHYGDGWLRCGTFK